MTEKFLRTKIRKILFEACGYNESDCDEDEKEDDDLLLSEDEELSVKDKEIAKRTPPKNKLNKGDFLPKSARDKINKKTNESVDKQIDRLILEIKKKNKTTLSEGMLYHIKKGVGVDRNIHRPGSTNFFRLFREARKLYREGKYVPRSTEEFILLEESDIGEFGIYQGKLVPLDYPIQYGNEEHLNEAEYKGKKVELNKPKRGEGGKAYVYVNSGKKTKDGKARVKKVTFGSSMPDAMGDSTEHRKRRKNFGTRHKCSEKDDKTKAGYWACRATKFFGRNISGWW